MKAMISADSAMAQVQGSMATRMEGRAGVLEAEIKLDGGRGWDVEAKKEELAEVEQKAATATASQMNTLADANKELDATKADQQTKEAETKETKADNKGQFYEEKQDGSIAGTEAGEKVPEVVALENSAEIVSTDEAETTDVSVSEQVTYTHVDVRL